MLFTTFIVRTLKLPSIAMEKVHSPPVEVNRSIGRFPLATKMAATFPHTAARYCFLFFGD